MIFLIFFLLLVPAFAGPKYNYPDPKLNDEMDSIYKAIESPKGLPTFTKAELLLITPRKAGLLYFCSDCTTDGVVVSTGVTVGGVARISARTTVIN